MEVYKKLVLSLRYLTLPSKCLTGMIDLYNISFEQGIEISKVSKELGVTTLDFSFLLNNKDKIEIFYKLKYKNSDDFNTIYSHVRDFCTPFITRRADKNLNAIWQPEGCVWFPYFG